MDKSKTLIIAMALVVVLALGVTVMTLFLYMGKGDQKQQLGNNVENKPKETLIYNVKGGEAIVANLYQKDKSKKSMMLRVAVTIEYDKGGFFKKPITDALTERDKIIESIVTNAIQNTSVEEVTTKIDEAKKAFDERLKMKLREEFGEDIYRVFTSEFIYN